MTVTTGTTGPADVVLSPLLTAGLVGLVVALAAVHWAPTSPPDRPVGTASPGGAGHLDDGQNGASPSLAARLDMRLSAVVAARRRRRARIRPAAVAAWLDDLSRSVRRGVTVRASLLDVVPDDGPLAERTDRLRHLLTRGAAVGAGCAEFADHLRASRRPAPDLVAVASVLAVASTSGGSVAEPLDRLAATMRSRASVELEREAQAAQATMSARVLTLLPVGVLVLLLATDEATRRAAVSVPGTVVIVLGLALNAVGGWWMRRIVGRPT